MYSDEESDFYGDEATVAELEARLEEFDADAWWKTHSSLPTPLKLQTLIQAPQDKMTHLHNPYAGCPYAWQLTETVDDFLDRLPPATTMQTPDCPWIYICNPYISRKPKASGQNQQVLGCEDEAPEEEDADIPRLMEGGMERLHFVTEFVQDFRNSGMTQVIINRETAKAGTDAAGDILNLARALHVTCGKWMIFCSVNEVNETWGVIVKATANNELGIAAKVAPKSESDKRSDRLICVYTADFSDMVDVRRVALKLKQLGLIQANGRPLYLGFRPVTSGGSDRPCSARQT